MSSKKIFSISFIAVLSIIIVVAGVYFLSQQYSQLPELGSALPGKQIVQEIISGDFLAKDVGYEINNGQGNKVYEFDYVASSTVFSALEAIGQKEDFAITFKDYPEMGVLIQSIGTTTNGTDNKYWQYWVNGVLGEVAADKKFLKPGDRVEWKFDIAPSF
ncbi:MAG: DUF4430 domain-containing protein [Candidatus Pacebacteria bacterium]|nr:DUF4430 domain-containing protein [Candidatus Paceibacterota bacterium]